MTVDPTNKDRARWAAVAVDAFAAVTHTIGEDLPTKVGDLLADLHHLCDAHGVSFQDCVERAEAHCREEVDDDEAGADPVAAVAQQYVALFNSRPLEDIDGLIADACVDPLWDERTNLLSLLPDDPYDQGLVLADHPEHYVVIRWCDGTWVSDDAPVDWEVLEDRAFAPDDDPAGA